MQHNKPRTQDFQHFAKSNIGWILTITLAAVPVIRWFDLNGLGAISSSSYGFFSTWGKLLGLVGMMLYCLNLIYSTRLRFLEDIFGGLNRVYVAHHIIGGFALIFLAFHPVLLAMRYIEISAIVTLRQAAVFLLPRAVTFPFNLVADKQAWAVNFGLIGSLGMVFLLVLTFFVKMPYQLWLFSHKFLGAAFFFAGLHILFINSDVSRDPFLRWYLLIWTVLGLAAFVYRTVMPKILVRRYKYQIDHLASLAGSITQIDLVPTAQKMSHQPGQFVFIRFLGSDKVVGEWHPFSISSEPGSANLQISVKALGDFTASLSGLNKGLKAEIEGAYGKFNYRTSTSSKQIWVAGGIGITPFLSMAKSITSSRDEFKPEVDLYYSVKTEAEMIEQKLLGDIGLRTEGQFRFIPWIGLTAGFLTAEIIAKQSQGLDGKDIFLCGPPAMMKAMRQQLRALGVPKRLIHSEEFSIQ